MASISLTGASAVDARAEAFGGSGGSTQGGLIANNVSGPAADGVAGNLGTVYGESTGGGGVRVWGAVHGGSGGGAFSTGPAGDGADVSLSDAVDGSTTAPTN